MPHTTVAPQHSPDLEQPDAEEVVLGVDSHQDAHVAAVITNLGAPVADRAFPATAAGYRQLLAWARRFGRLRRAGVEGTGSYGAALARHLRKHGVRVIEVNRAGADNVVRPGHDQFDRHDEILSRSTFQCLSHR
jgi:transposase